MPHNPRRCGAEPSRREWFQGILLPLAAENCTLREASSLTAHREGHASHSHLGDGPRLDGEGKGGKASGSKRPSLLYTLCQQTVSSTAAAPIFSKRVRVDIAGDSTIEKLDLEFFTGVDHRNIIQ